jgi:large subunit ribosomal protein L25
MAEKFVIKAEIREARGRNAARRLRHQGKVPVTVYGGGEDPVAATAELKDLARIIRSDAGANTLFTLDVNGGEESRVIFQDRQIDPVHSRLMHADLRRLAVGEKIELTIPVHVIGSAIGVREEGGMLEQQMREIRVLCTPSNIPESIDVNVEELELNDSISIADIVLDDEIEILESPESVVASVVFVKEVELEAPEEEEVLEPGLVGDDEDQEEGAEATDGDSEADSE